MELDGIVYNKFPGTPKNPDGFKTMPALTYIKSVNNNNRQNVYAFELNLSGSEIATAKRVFEREGHKPFHNLNNTCAVCTIKALNEATKNSPRAIQGGSFGTRPISYDLAISPSDVLDNAAILVESKGFPCFIEFLKSFVFLMIYFGE